MRHWAGTLQSGQFSKRQRNSTHGRRHPFDYLPPTSTSINRTFSRFKTRARFPADLLTWRSAGQGQGVKDVDGGGKSPVTVVAGIAALFFCCTIAVTVTLGVFCRKRNTVFPLEIKSDAEEDEDVDDCSGETVESTSKNFDHHHHHHHHRTRLDSTTCIHTLTCVTPAEPPGPLQLSPAHTPSDIVTQSSDQNDVHFRFSPAADVTDSPLPVESAHCDCCCEADVQPEDFRRVKSRDEHSVQLTNCHDSIASETYGNITAATASSSSSSSSSLSLSQSFFSLLSSLRKQQVMKSLGHVLSDVVSSRWIRRQRVPAATGGDQSAASDAARDDVDLTSLLPTL